MKVSITAIAIALLATANAQNVRNSLPKPSPSNRVCDYQSKGYFFSTLRTYGADSRAYCQSIGAELVSVDNSNFADLTQMIVKCLGPEQKAWVNSWDGNTFADSPLAIWTGLQSGSGSINININNEPLFGICSVRRRGLARPEPRPLIASGIAQSAISQSEDDASSASPDVESSSFAVPGFAVDPSEFPSAQDALFAENIDLNDAFGINSIAEDVIEDNLAENEVEENSAESEDLENEVEDNSVESEDFENVAGEQEENEEEEEEEEIAEEEAFEEEEEEYENEIVEYAEPVSVESNIQSIAPELFEYNLNV